MELELLVALKKLLELCENQGLSPNHAAIIIAKDVIEEAEAKCKP